MYNLFFTIISFRMILVNRSGERKIETPLCSTGGVISTEIPFLDISTAVVPATQFPNS